MQMAASRRSGEMADTLRSGRSTREGVGVRIPPSALLYNHAQCLCGLGAWLIWFDDSSIINKTVRMLYWFKDKKWTLQQSF